MKRYLKAQTEQKTDGRRACPAFDQAIVDKLWYSTVTKTLIEANGAKQRQVVEKIIFNIMYSYEMVRMVSNLLLYDMNYIIYIYN